MALVGIDPGATREFVSKYDPARNEDGTPGECATIFRLRALTSREKAYVRDRVTKLIPDASSPQGATADININDQAWLTARFGLDGWENFLDHDGNVIEFKTVSVNLQGTKIDVCKQSILGRLDLHIIKELAEDIDPDNELNEEDAKNSDG